MTNVDVTARRNWAYALTRKCSTPPPRYGSRAWLALSEGSPEKVAAVVIAAEAWASDLDNMPANLALELDNMRRQAKKNEDLEYVARAAEHRKQWGNLRVVPDRDGLAARVAEARTPRSGDFRPRRQRG